MDRLVGINTNPEFLNATTPTLIDPKLLQKLFFFQLNRNSTLRNKGLDLEKLFHIDTGNKDFFGNKIPRGESFEPGIHELE